MKYTANPVVVSAFAVLEIRGGRETPEGPEIELVIGDDQNPSQVVWATAAMCSRMTPKVGDYWVIQSDGYVYLNPKEVFERKYSALADTTS
jgi:hypothetical protein